MITAISLASAYTVRFDLDVSVVLRAEFLPVLALVLGVRMSINYAAGLPIGRWRFVGTRDFVRLFTAQTLGTVSLFVATWLLPFVPAVPRTVLLLEWALSGYGTVIVWVAYRALFERVNVMRAGRQRRIVLVGAGAAGEALVGHMLRSPSGLVPVVAVDDDPLKWGTSLHGIKVFGPIRSIGECAERHGADEIIISIPSLDRPTTLRRIVELCEPTGLPLKILPGVDEVLDGRVSMQAVREVQVEDLLGRDPVRLELPELAEKLVGKTVLVTGAAGSIGSELVRQLAIHRPGRLVLLDQAETPLFYLERAIRERQRFEDLAVIVGSVTNHDTVSRLMREHRPEWVFHAAAYKHVPLMESNPREAIRTNVLGTFLMAREAARVGTQQFVLVSTDKAVRPANVMGATKQMAERVVLGLQASHPGCSFAAVRFGNVLGSNGSVIPVFRGQLERGEPLTVTDERVTRYFMTIPEAVQLILQASLLPDIRGHVAMLDMGEPVRIMDLARDLLHLSGQPFRPGDNVVLTGLRPGEKLHEELAAPGETVLDTALERVSMVQMTNGYSTLGTGLLASLQDEDIDSIAGHVLLPLLERSGAPMEGGMSPLGVG